MWRGKIPSSAEYLAKCHEIGRDDGNLPAKCKVITCISIYFRLGWEGHELLRNNCDGVYSVLFAIKSPEVIQVHISNVSKLCVK